VTAFHATPANWQAAVDWLRSSGVGVDHVANGLMYIHYMYLVEYGDYLVKQGDTFEVIKPSRFHELYEEV
jgi:hypothetical protein